ncbi:hypothetical protein QOT17_004035 [Balamuthia mandrillaris]
MTRFLVAVDGSENSFRALERTLKLHKPGDSLLVVHVVETGLLHKAKYMTHEEVSEMMDNTAQQLVARAEQLCKDSNAAEAKCQVAKGNDCREKLIRLCEKNEIDVLVLGSRGSGAVASLLLGSTADHCLNNAHCSVFLVK